MVVISRAALLASALLILPALVEAHHATAMFDTNKEVTVQGVVKEFQFTNPHSWLLVDVTNKDGSVTTWGFEAEGPSTMLRNGIHKGDLPPGTKVTVTAHPMKDGQPAGDWLKAVRADGVEINPRPRPANAPAPPSADTPSASNSAPAR